MNQQAGPQRRAGRRRVTGALELMNLDPASSSGDKGGLTFREKKRKRHPRVVPEKFRDYLGRTQMSYSQDEIDSPMWARVVCGLIAGGVVVHIVRGWWVGSMRLVRFLEKHQVYVGSKGTTIVLTGPLELTAATLLLGGIALIF